ncbi:hypothetical protein L3Q82_001985 [Scortum barcoo]|uniref:Uncharacterized protein n=1 Tax=Scortum barcoo TaxID=214431 RepID=A0ACB8W2E7_9TELE|nr:hypothetical protein L3Q82_001985 [Scortum barcoo]
MSLGWPGNASGIPPEELEEVSGVEEMEVDDFYDGIKRLYNEDVTITTTIQEGATPAIGAITTGGGGALGVCSVLLSRQEGSSSPCPPLQPEVTLQ